MCSDDVLQTCGKTSVFCTFPDARCGWSRSRYINTPGGSVASGFAMFDTMQFTKSPVETTNVPAQRADTLRGEMGQDIRPEKSGYDIFCPRGT